MDTIKLSVAGTIRIEGLNKREREHIKKVLSLDNPLYWKLKNMGSPAVWATPKEFKYYREDGEVLIVPRGFRVRLLGWLGKMGKTVEVEELLIKKKL